MTTVRTSPAVRQLQDVILIAPVIRTFSGSKDLKPEDLGLNEGDLPSRRVISLGSKKLINPDLLKFQQTIKRAVERRCDEVGVKLRLGWAVPVADVQALRKDLDAFQAKYLAEKATFLRAYDKAVEDWLEENPDIAFALKGKAPDKAYIDGQITYRVETIAVNLDHPDPYVQETNAALRDSIPDRLFHEVAQFAQERMRERKGGVTARGLEAFGGLLSKLRSFQLFDHRVRPIADYLEGFLEAADAHLRTQQAGKATLEGPMLMEFNKLLGTFSDVHSLLSFTPTMVQPALVQTALPITVQQPVTSVVAPVAQPPMANPVQPTQTIQPAAQVVPQVVSRPVVQGNQPRRPGFNRSVNF